MDEPPFDASAELAAQMGFMAELAITLGRDSVGTELDFSEASIGRADAIALHYHRKFRPRLFKRPSEQEVSTVAAVLGAYVGETYRRAYGGTWGWIDQAPDPRVATMHAADGAFFFPVARARRFLKNGEEDSFSVYFAALRHLATGGSPETMSDIFRR
jgi:hypothetical protein